MDEGVGSSTLLEEATVCRENKESRSRVEAGAEVGAETERGTGTQKE